jgi:hypothetical protein
MASVGLHWCDMDPGQMVRAPSDSTTASWVIHLDMRMFGPSSSGHEAVTVCPYGSECERPRDAYRRHGRVEPALSCPAAHRTDPSKTVVPDTRTTAHRTAPPSPTRLRMVGDQTRCTGAPRVHRVPRPESGCTSRRSRVTSRTVTRRLDPVLEVVERRSHW